MYRTLTYTSINDGLQLQKRQKCGRAMVYPFKATIYMLSDDIKRL